MKIAVICPDTFIPKFQKIVADFPSVQFDYLIYKAYPECDELIKKQKNYDGILFSGLISYLIAKENLDESCLYEILPRYEGEVIAALLQVKQMGYSIERVSFDTYSRQMVKEALLEVGLTKSEEEIVGMKEIFDDYQSNQKIYCFHKNAVERGQADICVTTHNEVARLLKADGIPCIKSERTLDTIRMSVRRLEQRHMEREDRVKDLAVICIERKSYDGELHENYEYQEIMDKIRIMERIYFFARKLDGAVVEGGNGQIFIFTGKEILVDVTKKYTHFPLLETLENKIYNQISVGIGYGGTMAEAKCNALIAVKQARKYEESVIFLSYDSTKMTGPFGVKGSSEAASFVMQDQLEQISQVSGVGMKTLLLIRQAMTQMRKNTFTSKELAEYCGISVRNMDRMIEKLIISGYAGIAGMKNTFSGGRPSRLLIFYI